MTWYRRVAVGALVVLALTGAILWAHVTDRYVAASDIRIRIWGSVGIAEVRIPRIQETDTSVTIGVRFVIGNPSRIGIEIQQISYRFYMDNLTDTRPFALKADSIFVGTGGFYPRGEPAMVGPGATALIWANMTVFAATQPLAFERMQLSPDGKYYPIVSGEMVYRIQGTTIVDRVLGIGFSTREGVAPYGP